MRITTIARVATAFLLACMLASASRAQALADKVPADSFFYVGWQGTATPTNGYAGSHYQAVFEASKIRALAEQTVPQLIDRMEADEPEAAKALRAAVAIAAPLVRHPSALFVRPGGAEAGAPFSVVRAGLICQAGADAKSLEKQIRDAIELAPADVKPYLRVTSSDDTVMVLAGYGDADAQTAPAAMSDRAKSLATAAPFTTAMKHASAGERFFTVYIDAQRGLKLIDETIEREGGRGLKEWRTIRDALGIDGLGRMIFSGDFAEKNWISTAFVEAPAPRRGLLKWLEGRPVEPDALQQIPATVGGAQFLRVDIAGFVNLIRDVFAVVSPDEGVANFDRALGIAQMSLGVNPMTDIVEPLGETWVLFSDDSIAGNGTRGLIILNKLKDAEKANRGFAALWRFALNSTSEERRKEMQIALDEQVLQGLTVRSVQAPGVIVGWTIHNGNLVVGLNVDGVVKAAQASPAKGLDQSATFTALMKRMSQGNAVTSFRYMDLPQTVSVMDAELIEAWRTLREQSAAEDVKLPEEVLPPLDVVKSHVAPALEVSWMSDAGFHWRSELNFPAADAYSNQPNLASGQAGAAGAAGLGVAILLPSLNRARETANRVKCASNERQIGQAMLLYANDNKGSYPDDLGTLLLTQDITIDVFLCPSSDNSLPPEFEKMTPQQMAAWVNENSNYIYGGKGLNNSSPAEKILVIEKVDDHDSDGINCLFGDGHVEFVQQGEPNWAQVEELMKQGSK
ncbi:MAG: hypothetical protein H7Z14_22715 [Anaerolineae bacterium]|nr:hypothetical protein [Phycisphaerae bacterium]